jgi:hypothetical protein
MIMPAPSGRCVSPPRCAFSPPIQKFNLAQQLDIGMTDVEYAGLAHTLESGTSVITVNRPLFA